jgi:hypothetical protein
MNYQLSDLPGVYDDFEILLEQGDDKDARAVAYNCELIVADHAFESRAWFIGSKACQKLRDSIQAHLYAETALKIEPVKLEYLFQLFNVLIQLCRTSEIPALINVVFSKLGAESKADMIRYAGVAIDSGLISKFELSDTILVEILRLRQT